MLISTLLFLGKRGKIEECRKQKRKGKDKRGDMGKESEMAGKDKLESGGA